MRKWTFGVNNPGLNQEYFGLNFKTPVGLAAGFDKNGYAVKALQHLGFGYLEIGSISNRPSAGNQTRPRLFRIPQDRGIIVNYGVPNDGAKSIAHALRDIKLSIPLGVNVVETNTGSSCPVEETIEDIIQAVQPFTSLASYISVNLNCPNTNGEQPFDEKANLMALLNAFNHIRDIPPLLLKVTVTSDPVKIDGFLDVASQFDFVKGFIFNLASGNPHHLKTSSVKLDKMSGAVSGLPVKTVMNQAIKSWYRMIDPNQWIIIGSGGIFEAQDAYEKIKLGASLLQLYTSLIYEGPGVVNNINKGLLLLMERDGIKNIAEAIGTDNQ
ncbi:MAG: dihydroorotate dehydrogenase 2 [Cyclobacteriaceae bacterium]|nr:MAG: dihydroorotate dehydrogenase 2 [Cyclobacteriaceae bacterium]